MLTYLVAVDPLNVVVEIDGRVLVEVAHFSDRLSEQLGQSDPHLLLHQGEPLVDLGVISDRHGCLVDDLRGNTYG